QRGDPARVRARLGHRAGDERLEALAAEHFRQGLPDRRLVLDEEARSPRPAAVTGVLRRQSGPGEGLEGRLVFGGNQSSPPWPPWPDSPPRSSPPRWRPWDSPPRLLPRWSPGSASRPRSSPGSASRPRSSPGSAWTPRCRTSSPASFARPRASPSRPARTACVVAVVAVVAVVVVDAIGIVWPI